MMGGVDWIPLETIEQLKNLKRESESQPVVIYKHSTRCGTSHMVLNRLQRSARMLSGARLYFLDLLEYPSLSGMVANAFSVHHESPQILVIRDGIAILHLSHFDIDPGLIAQCLH